MWCIAGAVSRESLVPVSLLVGSICSVVGLLFCCVVLIHVIRRRRHQGKYPVHEKEKRHGANGGNLYEEAQFGEYVRLLNYLLILVTTV